MKKFFAASAVACSLLCTNALAFDGSSVDAQGASVVAPLHFGFGGSRCCEQQADPCQQAADPCQQAADPCQQAVDPCQRANPCARHGFHHRGPGFLARLRARFAHRGCQQANPCQQAADPCQQAADPCQQAADPCQQARPWGRF